LLLRFMMDHAMASGSREILRSVVLCFFLDCCYVRC
jgi:hypothetical protein